MHSRIRRAGGFAAVALLSLLAPTLGVAAAIPFLAVAGAAAFLIREGPAFELFARPGDRRDGRLNGLAGFALAAAGLGLFATIPRVAMPVRVYAAAIILLAVGNLGRQIARSATDEEFLQASAFVAAGALAGTLAQMAIVLQTGATIDVPRFVFLAAVGALAAALLRAMLLARDDPIVMISIGFLLWLFDTLVVGVTVEGIVLALGVTIALGYVSYALGTASVPGMLTGVLLGLLTIILGDVGWFLVLISFYAIGGLASKFRFEQKAERGVAQENEGARGTGNVLANSAIALAAVVGYAATVHLSISGVVFALAFAGAVSTAMADTLASEIGGLYERPRLVTTLEPVPSGTDGAITVQGELAGLAGAMLIGALAAMGMPIGPAFLGGAVVTVAGFLGMTVDSLLGALVEGDRIGNQTVNLLATLAGAIVAAGCTPLVVG
ncbi:TIGR00297 family protein [Halopenitus sp. H-Gu1]|uniref:DUF92 domain-containing protein n=1 Tax=Halopenitus sp. H-Gu1 TaxID=3242697 RepID=UPI00359D98FF